MVPVAATTTCEDFYSDDEEDLLPSRKRRRDNCPCYKCTGDAFRVTHPSGIEAAATSICATIRLGCSVTRADLKDFTNRVNLGMMLNGAMYNPRRCPAVQISTSHPETSVNLYSCETGPAKLVCLGARTKSQARTALRRVARSVQQVLAVEAEFLLFTVSNYIMSGDLKFEVNLDDLLKTLNSSKNNQNDRNTASYEPELSPKLAYHMEDPVTVKLDIFHTGKMNVLRCLGREDLQQAFAFLYPLIIQHKIKPEPAEALIAPPAPVMQQLPEPVREAQPLAAAVPVVGGVVGEIVVSPRHGEMLDGAFSDMLDELM
eukprot:TRINITY_DN18334_c0_g1_i3.p1 TRINITY_DN18334_c0_g1~~TRINITY_DN18334_c0_g1_i3.p1  ORF type:complete len:316 (+),score=63.18 TRINITY_DN18334_c0_g1_i3:207-1154(+)